jgi:hypothetical protein
MIGWIIENRVHRKLSASPKATHLSTNSNLGWLNLRVPMVSGLRPSSWYKAPFKWKTLLSILMANVKCSHFGMQWEDIVEHTNAKHHLCTLVDHYVTKAYTS